MTKKILLVDDDPNVLQGFKRHLRKTYELELAVGGTEAIETFRSSGPFAVVVSDMQMPEMNGVEFLAKIRNLNEQTVRIMLTGNADQRTAVDAVNEGCIFRFLSKPCPPETLAKTLDAGLEHYRLVTAEAELLGKTLAGSVRMLTQVLSLVMPEAFGLTQEARTLVRAVSERLGISPIWEMEMASMLMRIGCVSLPHEVMTRYLQNQALTPEQLELVKDTPRLGQSLIAAIPRLEGVAKIIAQQESPLKDSPLTGSRVLKVVGDFQRLRFNQSPLTALRMMKARVEYDSDALGHLSDVIESTFQRSEVNVSQLSEGMVLEENVVDLSGRVLIAKGSEMHETIIAKLSTLRRSGCGVKEPIQVRLYNQNANQRSDQSLAS